MHLQEDNPKSSERRSQLVARWQELSRKERRKYKRKDGGEKRAPDPINERKAEALPERLLHQLVTMHHGEKRLMKNLFVKGCMSMCIRAGEIAKRRRTGNVGAG